jgi:hypothetical protein
MEETLLDKTYRYVDAFHNRKIDVIDELLAYDVHLKDPSVNITSKSEVLAFIENLYAENNVLEFNAAKIMAFPEQNFSLIEFVIIIGQQDSAGIKVCNVYKGTDHITWNKYGQIEDINAYLY